MKATLSKVALQTLAAILITCPVAELTRLIIAYSLQYSWVGYFYYELPAIWAGWVAAQLAIWEGAIWKKN